jgi:hypothetical protein
MRPSSAEVLVHAASGASWAWCGVRAGPAPTLTATGGYAGRPETERLAWLRPVERVWLDGLWDLGAGRFEVRYVNDPASGLVSCALLASTFAATPEDAAARALVWRERLESTPDHVVTAPLGTDELREHLASSFRGPVVREIRKRLLWAWTERPDAPFPIGVAVLPFHGEGRSWESVWTAMAAAKRRVVIGVCLEPRPPDPGLLSALDRLRREHARLAAATDTGPVYTVRLGPDPVSIIAAPLYEDALRRYRRTWRTHRVRITVAAEEEMPDVVPELLAAAVSPRQAQSRAVVLSPAGGEEDTAWRNVAGLGQARLERTYQQGMPPGHPDPAVRDLAGLVDQDEGRRRLTELLEALIQELSNVSPDHSALEALKGSREHWRRQSP